MFSANLIIQKKRDGTELSTEELAWFIQGLSNGEVTDYQASAFLMAVYFKGMTLRETVALTQAMLDSGEKYDLSLLPGIKIDKHSTGGVGDKVSLILAPLAAACGLKVPMMSGRGLGHSGGTLDKLESIPGFNTHLDRKTFERVLLSVGCAMIGQSETIAPADRRLYALRDVTATVECVPLIVASILSKKLAEGTQGLVLDVKVGSGAFMKTKPRAKLLAKTLLQVAKKLNLRARALLTNMDQPLGYAVGNSLEVLEAVEILRDEKLHPYGETSSADLKELTIQLCAHMLVLGEKVPSLIEGRKLAHQRLADQSAWNIFLKLIEAQSGNTQKVQNPLSLPLSKCTETWAAPESGFISGMDAQIIGELLIELGGGRKKISDEINPGVGFIFHKKLGSRVREGENVVTVLAQESSPLSEMRECFMDHLKISPTRPSVPKLISETLNG